MRKLMSLYGNDFRQFEIWTNSAKSLYINMRYDAHGSCSYIAGSKIKQTEAQN